MGPDALQTQLEDLKDQMEAIEEMNKKMSEEQGRKDRDLEIKMALEDIKSSETKKAVRKRKFDKIRRESAHKKKSPKFCWTFVFLATLNDVSHKISLKDENAYGLALSFGRHWGDLEAMGGVWQGEGLRGGAMSKCEGGEPVLAQVVWDSEEVGRGIGGGTGEPGKGFKIMKWFCATSQPQDVMICFKEAV